jgi:hypothetical protein
MLAFSNIFCGTSAEYVVQFSRFFQINLSVTKNRLAEKAVERVDMVCLRQGWVQIKVHPT